MLLIKAIARSWWLTNAELANLLAIPTKILIPDLLKGPLSFKPNSDTAERLRIIYSIHACLAYLFLNPADEARWIHQKLPILANLSPLHYMLQFKLPGIFRLEAVVRDMTRTGEPASASLIKDRPLDPQPRD